MYFLICVSRLLRGSRDMARSLAAAPPISDMLGFTLRLLLRAALRGNVTHLRRFRPRRALLLILGFLIRRV